MAIVEFPIGFENPLLGIVGFVLGGIFVLLFYLSYKRVRIAEKRLELVKWQKVRRLIYATNFSMKISIIIALSFLLAIPYLTVTIEVPIEELSQEQKAQNSITIMLLMDVSYSMNTSDLTPTRLQVSKQMATLLVNTMDSADLIGFLSFANEIYDEILPTLNRSDVVDVIDNQTLQPSTAIGTALEAALGVLEAHSGGKAIVLFSDGKNNVGVMNLTSVAETASAMKIPVFTVFVGTYSVGEVDPVILQDIADVSGGKSYEVRSEDIETLATEVSIMSQEVKVGALKSAFDKLSFEAKDYYTPMLFFAVLLVASVFLTWFTGV